MNEKKRIIVRILILDIFEKKKEGALRGENSGEEYIFYEKNFLNNEIFMEYVLRKYPELDRLLRLHDIKLDFVRTEINKRIGIDNILRCSSEKRKKVKELKLNQGDTHKNGHSVSKVEFTDGSILYYKPHSLDKNLKYQKLYKHLCEKAGISCREVKYLSRQTYGWEENIENKSCNTKEEVERYYFRLGIHLFLGYALGATDLHGENIVAHGEYPVIIDMETYPGYIAKSNGSSTEDKTERKIREKIMTSVLSTGILPVLTWGSGNQRVLMSAVNMHGKIRTPFKMPLAKDDKTSDIHDC